MKNHYLKTGSKKVMSAVLLAAAMMVSLAACGGNAEESKVPESSVVESTVQESTVEESTEESTEETGEGNPEEGSDVNGSESKEIEVRTYILEVDGADVEFEEGLFRSEAGYQVWYPTSLAEMDELDGYDGFVLLDEAGAEQAMVVIAPADALTDMDEMLNEAAAGYGEEADVTVGEIVTLEMEEDSILAVKSIEVTQSEGVDRYYAVNDGEKAVMISVTATAETMEEMSLQFDRMASTVEFGVVEAAESEVVETETSEMEAETTETETMETETGETAEAATGATSAK